MDPVFVWIEDSPLNHWVTGPAFEAVIVAHTLGVALVAGPSLAIALCILGAAPVPPSALRRFFPVVWLGLAASAPSGLLLLVGYPTKALTNPVFYLKLGAIALGLALLLRVRARVLTPSAEDIGSGAPGTGGAGGLPRGAAAMAWASLALWIGAITAGRLLAYTYTHLTAADL